MQDSSVTCVTCEFFSKTQLGQEEKPGHGEIMVRNGNLGGILRKRRDCKGGHGRASMEDSCRKSRQRGAWGGGGMGLGRPPLS